MSCQLASQVSPPSLQIPNGRDVQEVWTFIRDRIYKPFSGKKVANSTEYMACYSAVVNLLVYARVHHAYPNVQKLYSNIEAMLKKSLETGVEPALTYSGNDAVKFYVSAWDSFSVGTKYNSRVLNYMSRHYITRIRIEGRTDVHFIPALHAVCWKNMVFDKLAEELRRWVRDAEEVHGKATDIELFKGYYERLREEMNGTGEVMMSFEEFCTME